jgi:hypothetical protein
MGRIHSLSNQNEGNFSITKYSDLWRNEQASLWTQRRAATLALANGIACPEN